MQEYLSGYPPSKVLFLLVFSADEKRVKYFRFTGAKRFQADHMVVLQLKPGATVAMAKY